MPRRGTNGDDARVRARREFNRLYRARRLAAEAAGLPFVTYNAAMAMVAAEMRAGQLGLDQVDIEQLFDRATVIS
jgi:hypothetical protein